MKNLIGHNVPRFEIEKQMATTSSTSFKNTFKLTTKKWHRFINEKHTISHSLIKINALTRKYCNAERPAAAPPVSYADIPGLHIEIHSGHMQSNASNTCTVHQTTNQLQLKNPQTQAPHSLSSQNNYQIYMQAL